VALARVPPTGWWGNEVVAIEPLRLVPALGARPLSCACPGISTSVESGKSDSQSLFQLNVERWTRFVVGAEPAPNYELCGGQTRVDQQRGTDVGCRIGAHTRSDQFDELAVIVLADQCRFVQ
jgi:hypothetical protein